MNPTLAAAAGPRTARPLSALIVAASAGFAIAGAIALSNGAARAESTPLAALTLVAALSFIASGFIAWRRRPQVLIWVLMIAAGFCLFANSLSQSNSALPYTIGIATGPLAFVVLAHLVLAFPDGRLHSRLERIVVGIGYLDATVVQVTMLMFMGMEHMRGCPCPENLLLVRDDSTVHGLLMNSEYGIGVAGTVAGIAIVARRWRGASGPLRRALAPVVVTGAVTIALLGASLLLYLSSASSSLSTSVSSVQRVALATVPVAYVFGLLRSRLARVGVSDLMVALRHTPEPGQLREVLATALRDPSLELSYWMPESQGYVGIDGQPSTPIAAAGRSVTPLERHGRRVAALVHDAALEEEPALLEAVSAAAGLALENERLLADLRAQLEELRESRARIVAAGDTERRRLERNLHDGAQQRLVSLALALNLARDKIAAEPGAAAQLLDAASEELTHALAELRELAEGIHPAVLTDRGLEYALYRLAERAPVAVDISVELPERPPAAIEAAAYYVVAESLTNVAKYGQASKAQVRIARERGALRLEVIDDGIGGADPAAGSGLRGLNDRVQAFGGELEIDSPRGGGTRITAQLPL